MSAPTLTNTAIPAHTATPTSLPETATPTRPPAPTSAVVVRDGRGSLYRTLFAIPVGKDGVSYWAGTTEITGPNAITVLPDGNLVISDFNNKRLLFYHPTGGSFYRAIDLASLGIDYAYDVRAGRSALFVLEGYDRYRLHRISLKGELEASYDILGGLRIETGVTGIAIGSQDEVLVEMGGAKFYQLLNSYGKISIPPTQTGYPYGGRQYWVNNPGIGGTPQMTMDGIKIETKLSGGSQGLGGLGLLGVLPNGDFFVKRDDVIGTGVDQTVHYMNAQGVQLGVARFPLAERYYSIQKEFAIAPDGNVIALLPHPDSLKVVQLIFYKHLDPLVPGAVEPMITLSGNNP